MPIFNSVLEYQQYNLRRGMMLVKNADRSQIQAAKFTVAMVRSMAPMKSGRLRRGIIRRGNQVSARASKGKFPYIHWINQTRGQGLQTLKMRMRGGRFVSGKNKDGTKKLGRPAKGEKVITAIYGSSPNWNWTGQAKFFDKGVALGRKHFRNLSRRALNKSLRAEAI